MGITRVKKEAAKVSGKRLGRPDDVSDDFPDGAIKLSTKLLPPTEDGEAAKIWIEGDEISLQYLGKMILAQAAFPLDCLYGISPKSAGRAFFDRKAKLGIVIHRLPCMNPALSGSQAKKDRARKAGIKSAARGTAGA